jgi:protease-4
MKQFFKFMFASMAGFFVSIVLLVLILVGIVSGIMMGLREDEQVTVSDNSVLEIKFEDPVTERTNKSPFEQGRFSFTLDRSPGLEDILKNIDKAKSDDHIKGILLDVSSFSAGIATMEEIRVALTDFKKSGKFIYSYCEGYPQGGYYLATVADKIYLNPEGEVDLHGLSVDLMFFKGTLEKLDLKPEIIRHGKYKSAVEPFMYDKMSPENKEQISKLLHSIWDNVIENIATARKITREEVQTIADNLSGRTAKEALDAKLVDKLIYYDEVLDELRMKTGIEKDEKVKFITMKKYTHASGKKDFSADKIAVVYAAGEIVSGEGNDDQVGSEKIAAAIRKARMDSTIKAIVLRVNSPGGSAIASDVIWRETMLAKKVKPFIVSMGDYAASGGYYISCAADTIVCRPNTLTGSIGVFGLLFNTQDMFKNKLGITFDTVKTAKLADYMNMTKPMSEGAKAAITTQVEGIYRTFVSHVSQGRSLDAAFVDSIGQGRVWSGTDAKQLGLVDVLGGINDAIAIAAKKANLSSYRTIALPEQKEFFEKLLEDMNTEASVSIAKNSLGENYQYYESISKLLKKQGIQARMPVDIIIK